MHVAHWFGLWTCLFACWELSQAYLGIHIDDAEKITSEPRGSRTLETTPAQQKEKTLQRTPVWCRPNILRRSS